MGRYTYPLVRTVTVYHDCYVRVTAYLRTVKQKSGGQLEPML